MENLTLDEDTTMFVTVDNSDSTDSNASDETERRAEKSSVKQRVKLNEFLKSCNVDAIQPWRKRWQNISTATKKKHVSETSSFFAAALNVIAPGDADELWTALKASNSVEKALHTNELETPEDRKYLEALAESYENASTWETRRQILSVLADKVTFKKIQSYIPGLTSYRFTAARKHTLEYGRGALLPPNKSPRMRIDSKQLDQFLSYITSPHVVQDLPFGQRYMHLSSGEVLETPNVIRTMTPQRILLQYQGLCKESGFKLFSRNTALRILSVCGATIRKSLQGLDYIAADGAKAFDDLCKLVERLEECGLSMQLGNTWRKSLKEGKQYLKADFKVMNKNIFNLIKKHSYIGFTCFIITSLHNGYVPIMLSFNGLYFN